MTYPYTPTSYHEEWYERLLSLTRQDEAQGRDLFNYIYAQATMFDQIEGYARDQGDTPGWAHLLDVDIAPVEALPWLAQFVGVSLYNVTTEAEQRAKIRSADGMNRGTVASMVAAAKLTLTGGKNVRVIERSSAVDATDSGAWGMLFTTATAETPNATATYNALLSQKPAGIIIQHVVSDDPLWEEVNPALQWDSVGGSVTWDNVTRADVT